jgi:hypothetical protein
LSGSSTLALRADFSSSRVDFCSFKEEVLAKAKARSSFKEQI